MLAGMTVGLLTNHGHVLVCVAGEPGMTLREIAECVGVTERTAHTIVCELEKAGYLTRHREGRRNRYEVHADAVLGHELEHGGTVGDLVAALAGGGAARSGVAAGHSLYTSLPRTTARP
jgi:DNA-binding Lrp family transcriptional regulator